MDGSGHESRRGKQKIPSTTRSGAKSRGSNNTHGMVATRGVESKPMNVVEIPTKAFIIITDHNP